MIFMATSTYPGTSIGAAARKMIEIVTNDPPPDYIKRTYYVTYGGKGIKTYAFYDIEEGKEKQGFMELSRRQNQSLQSVDGIELTVEVVLTLEEAFASIDMQAP